MHRAARRGVRPRDEPVTLALEKQTPARCKLANLVLRPVKDGELVCGVETVTDTPGRAGAGRIGAARSAVANTGTQLETARSIASRASWPIRSVQARRVARGYLADTSVLAVGCYRLAHLFLLTPAAT